MTTKAELEEKKAYFIEQIKKGNSAKAANDMVKLKFGKGLAQETYSKLAKEYRPAKAKRRTPYTKTLFQGTVFTASPEYLKVSTTQTLHQVFWKGIVPLPELLDAWNRRLWETEGREIEDFSEWEYTYGIYEWDFDERRWVRTGELIKRQGKYHERIR